MKKLFKAYVILMMIFAFLPINIYAEDTENIIILCESDPIKVNKEYVYEFVDLNLVDNNSKVVPCGRIVPEYSHSYYTYSTHVITSYSVGPKEKNKFLFSLAGGQSLHVSKTISESASLGYQRSLTVGEKDVICGYLGFNASGSKTVTLEISQTITAPSEYESYSYYSAIDYDMYKFTLYKNDVYNNVDQTSGKITGTFTDRSTVIVDVKVPKAIYYYKGTNV